MEEKLGEMRKGRRERMRKGAIVSSSPQGMTSWSSSSKFGFFKLIECIIKKKRYVMVDGGQRIDQKRKKGW